MKATVIRTSALLAIVLFLCGASTSSAAVTVGNPLTSAGGPLGCSGTPCTVMILGVPGGGQVTAPTDGVIVRWRLRDSAGNSFVLRVLRPAAGGQYTFVSSSAPATGLNPGTATFGTQQPVKAGDYIGVSWDGTDGLGATDPAAGSNYAFFNSAPADSSTMAPTSSTPNGIQPLFNADVEADADHDGFGDETQDHCPGGAGPNAGCPLPPPPPPPDKTPPTLASAAHSAKLSAKGALSFFITSNENATGTATGAISVPKLAKIVRFARRNVTLTANKATKITLKLSKRNAKLVRKALAAHKKLKARITLSVKDAAGNATTKRLSLRLKR